MILIVSFEANEHVERVRRHLRTDSVLLDQSHFPARMRLDARVSQDFTSSRMVLPDGSQVLLDEVGAVWNRRAQPLTLRDDLTDQRSREFAWSESTEAILGLWHSLDCFWMNPLSADDSGQRKLLQLKRARSLGLSVPETVITNDPAVARIFVDLYGPDKVIRKGFRSLPNVPLYTSRMTGIDLGANSGLEHAPVIFQRFVEVDVDLRVTMVDGEVFAASIRSQPGYEADYRPGLSSAEVEPYELPDDVTTKLRALMKDLGLVYGAVDFRVTPEGEHVFLEINPAGEYLFIADRTGQPIPQAIAACLDRHDAEFSRSIVG